MFLFRNMEDWSNKKLYGIFTVVATLWVSLVLVGPVSMIAWKYNLFTKVDRYKLSGAGLITAIIIGIVCVVLFNKLVAMLPEYKHSQQCLKYFIQGLIACIMPCLFLWVLQLLKSNFELGYTTSLYCTYFILSGIFVYYFALKFLIAEISLRNKTAEAVAIDRRKKHFQK